MPLHPQVVSLCTSQTRQVTLLWAVTCYFNFRWATCWSPVIILSWKDNYFIRLTNYYMPELRCVHKFKFNGLNIKYLLVVAQSELELKNLKHSMLSKWFSNTTFANSTFSNTTRPSTLIHWFNMLFDWFNMLFDWLNVI